MKYDGKVGRLFLGKVQGNIFEEFISVKQTIMESSTTGAVSVYDEEYVKMLEVIENYFKSMKWAKNDKERAIYLRSGKGLKTSTIANALGVNPNTYRSLVSTVSKRLRDLLFDGEDMSVAILEADRDKVVSLRKHIEFLLLSFDFYSMYSSHELELIQRYSEQRGVIAEPTERELFDALMVLVMINNRTTEYRLQTLNQLALKKVFDELTSNQYSMWVKYYQELGMGGKPVASDTLIQRLKQSAN